MTYSIAVLCYITGMIGMRQLIRFLYKDISFRKEHCSTAKFYVVFWPAGALLISIGIVSDWFEKWLYRDWETDRKSVV